MARSLARSGQFKLVRLVRSAWAALWQWRLSMFWKLVPLMFLASGAFGVFTIIKATLDEDARVRAELAPGRLTQTVQRVLHTSVPLASLTSAPERWCADTLRVLSERIFARVLADRGGDDNVNSFNRSVQAGRLAAVLSLADGHRCTFAGDDVALAPALRRQLDSPASGEGSAMVEQADGWISVARVAQDGADGEPGPVLTVGAYLLSPLPKLAQRGSIFGPLAIFIFYTNVVTALVLVFVVIRRIRRADRVVGTWTVGDLSARIHDQGRDEFSRLTQKLDSMADALSTVIDVKQALAASEERNRMARDLHDTAKQRAFALNLQLSAARKRVDPASTEGRLIEAAFSLSSQLQGDLAGVIQPLLAPVLEADLRRSLEDGVARMLEGSGIAWRLVLDPGDEADLAARPDLTRPLLLLTIEAVANVLKHSHATLCTITCSRAGSAWHWSIADNGRGMQLASASEARGVGLASMKLRASRLPGGAFDIAPANASGTVIHITFRFEENNPP